MKECLFCHHELTTRLNHKRQKTKEHIFPMWLLEEFELKGKLLTFSNLEAKRQDGQSAQLTPPLPIRELTLNKWVLGNICASCNNGWLSELENSTKPDLIALIEGGASKIQNGTKLAGWIAKTAYILSCYLTPPVGGLPKSWGDELYLSRGNLPSDTAVFFTDAIDPSYWFSIPSTFEIRSRDKYSAQRVSKHSAKIIFQIGRISFQVVWSKTASCIVHYPAHSTLIASTKSIQPEFGERVPKHLNTGAVFQFMMSNALNV